MTALRFIAELSSNAATSLGEAIQLVDEAAGAGATDIKVQCWSPGTMAFDGAYMIPSGPWQGRDLAELYRATQLPWEWIKPIAERTRYLGLRFGSSVFDHAACEYITAIGADFLKIASFEITDLPLIGYAASYGIPLIISTGMAAGDEVDRAVIRAQRAAPAPTPLALLACSSSYPCRLEHAHVARVRALRFRHPQVEVGYSDHTEGTEAAAAAVALGATIIERHIALEGQRSEDSHFSARPVMFRAMVEACWKASKVTGGGALGAAHYELHQLRRGLHWAQDFPPGHVVAPSDMVTARPSSPTPIHLQHKVIGKPLAVAVRRGQPVDLEGQINGG